MEHDVVDGAEAGDDGFLAHVPIEIMVSVGRAKPLLRDLMSLEKDTVLMLDKHIDDPVELFVGDRLIGMGQLEVQGNEGQERLAIRVTDVLPVSVTT